MKSLFQFTIISTLILTCANVHAQWSTNPAVNLQISYGVDGAAVPYVVNHPCGTMYLGWFAPNGTTGDYYPWIQKLDAFGNEQWVSSGINISTHPSMTWITDYDLAVCPDTSVLIAFQDTRNGANDVFIYKLAPDGSFLWGGDGVELSNDANFEANPVMAVSSDNSVVVAWPREVGGGDNQVMVQRLDANGNKLWDPPLQLSETGFDYAWPVVVPDGEGNTILVWFKEYGPYWAPNRIVLAQKFDPEGLPVWPSNASLFTGSMPVYVHPLVAADGTGGAYVCWTYEKTANKLSSFVQHVDNNGLVTMPTGGVNVSVNPGTLQLEPAIACDTTTQDLYIFWRETNLNQTQFGLAGQRLKPDGTIMWGNNGIVFVPISSKNTSLINVIPLPGGAIVSYDYDDFGSVTQQKVKVFRIDDLGNHVWTPNIKDISSYQSGKGYLAAGDIMNGQVVFAWSDDRNSGEQVFAQNISESGTLGPLDYDFGIYPDTLYFVEPNDFVEGKEFYIINPNPNTLDVQYIQQTGDMNCACVPWYIDPAIPGFPVLIAPDDSLKQTVKFLIIDQVFADGMTYDSLFISTITDTKWVIIAADSMDILIGTKEADKPMVTVFPNPFVDHLTVRIRTQTPETCNVNIYDPMMRLVRKVSDGVRVNGDHRLLWYGRDDANNPVCPGIYFLEIKTLKNHQIVKIIKN